MPEYIKLKDALHIIDLVAEDNTIRRTCRAIRKRLKELSTEDVAEVKHGKWIEYQTPNIICCSECDWGTGVDEKTFNYCPNCGAKMDLKEGVKSG